jgi:hypothetical protein
MDMEPPGQGPEEGEAEQAFEALHEEVTALRRGIEMLYRCIARCSMTLPPTCPRS